MARRRARIDDDQWERAQRLADLLDAVLRTAPGSDERAEAVDDLAARLKRTPQTIRRYLRKYQKRRLVKDLVRNDSGRKPRLSTVQDAILRAALEERYLVRESVPLHQCWIVANGRLEDAGLKTVAYNTLTACLHRHWTEANIARLRGGQEAVRPYRRRGRSLQPEYPLQVCQIDETEVDVLARDADGNLLRRLWVVVLVDVLTRVILGLWLWPRSPNREAIGLCVMQAIRPKRDLFRKHGIDAVDIYGRPETIISDRASWYKALAEDKAIQDLRIHVDPRRGEPHIRNVVERLQGVINQHLRVLPGQTGHSTGDRGSYPSEGKAALSFNDLEEAVLIAAYRICNGEMDMKTLKRPDLEWERQRHLIPEHLLVGNWEDVHLAFLPEMRKALSSKGIRHNSLEYWDECDPRLLGLYQNRYRHDLRVKINRNDISHVYLHHPQTGEWFPVPRADGDLRPITEWERKAERAAERAEAGTTWSQRAQDRDRIVAIGRRAAAAPTQGKSKKLSRKDATDALAADLARQTPKPRAQEMELNRLKMDGSGLGDLPETDDIWEAEEWKIR